ncbi:MAG: 2-oxo acid dehydrogenase subunit E2 [Chloroflexi bacterium]|nr:2-oxo acid dehydrogenase subunit E2 [Chloroflexota bacterium]
MQKANPLPATLNQNCTVEPFPATRNPVVDAGRLGSRRHLIHGLMELDVTTARAYFRAHKARTGASLSFTGFLVACWAHAIEGNKSVQAYRNWRNQLVIFDDVDVVILIETQIGGVALPHILRGASRKTFRQINDEIRGVQSDPSQSSQTGPLMEWGARAPAFVRDLFYTALRVNPHWLKQFSGTTTVTSVGMFGAGSGWGIGFMPWHTLGLTVGGLTQKPGVVNGTIVVREYLCVTLSVDHDIVDGAPAARLGRQLKELIESGYGLEEEH